MDQKRFDDLARLVGAGGTRRRVLALIGGTIASAVLGPRGARACAGQECGPGLPDCCGGFECADSGTGTGVCIPFPPQCAEEGNACISDDGCCGGKCCDGTCHVNYGCCPTDFTSQSPDCAEGQTCDNNGTCVEMPSGCGNDGDTCGADGDCCEGICCGGTCRSGAACCWEDGVATPHCGIGQFCNDAGFCEDEPTCGGHGTGCASDDQCCEGVCCEGICQSSFQCCPSAGPTDPRCGDGMVCDGGTCQQAPRCQESGGACQADDDCCADLVCSSDGVCAPAVVPDPPRTKEQCKAIRERVAELNALKAQLTAEIAAEPYKPRRVRLRRVRRTTQSKINLLRRKYAQDCR